MAINDNDKIVITGARVHNLKNIDLEIPRRKLVVITGLSGSGKSTLAFDTIFAEGQRRYVESLSAYARQFLGKINKPDVDIITGIAPAIAIEQKVNTRNPRSTVGTTTEIYDYLKLLYARIGHTFSPVSGQEVRCFSVDDVAAYILAHDGQRVAIGAPLVLGEGQGIIEKLTLLLSDGLMRVYTDGQTRLIEEILPSIDETTGAADIQVVIDRMRIAPDDDTQTRIRDSVARAFSYGDGICTVISDKGAAEFSSRFEADGIEFEHPSEHLFSFNNPLGACPRCEGYGKVIGIDEDLVIPDKGKTIYEDAIACWRGETMRKWKEKLVENAYKFDFPIHTPFHELTQEQKRLLWRGNEYFHGLDEQFAVAFNDVDFCLRVRDAGWRIVWTPYAELYHHESKSRGSDENDPAKKARFDAEHDRLYAVHGKENILHDPYYSPSLSLDYEDFRESGDLRHLK